MRPALLHRVFSPPAVLYVALCLFALLQVGCDGPTVYRVEKETQTASSPGSAAASTMPPGAPHWSTPPSWIAQAPGQMQVALWSIPAAGSEAQVSVSTIPGDAGGDLSNVNRWRRQLGLPPIGETALAEMMTGCPTGIGAANFLAIDTEGTSLRVAWLEVDNQSWFFKLTGPQTAVIASEAGFTAMLQSLHDGRGHSH